MTSVIESSGRFGDHARAVQRGGVTEDQVIEYVITFNTQTAVEFGALLVQRDGVFEFDLAGGIKVRGRIEAESLISPDKAAIAGPLPNSVSGQTGRAGDEEEVVRVDRDSVVRILARAKGE